MGKERTKRYKPAKYQPVELEAGNLVENEEKIRGTVSNIIGMLNSVSCEERECGCVTISNFVSQTEAIPLLLRSNVIKIMGPLMMDSNLSVRCAAVGAFRNLSVAGGEDVCNEMVKEDILTSLVALFKQYEPGWIPNSSQHTDLNSVVFLNAVHLLWNLCEFSEVAVKVVNKQDLMSLLMSCINPEKYDHLICTAAAQCVYTASESNREAVILLSLSNHKAVLERFIQQKTGDNTDLILLRTLLTGIAYNIITQQEESADLGVIHSIVNVLSDTLSFEVVNHVQLAVQALKQMQQKEKDECAMDPVEPKLGAMADDLERRSHAADKSIEDIENILNAQKLSLEMIANLCCLNSEDEDWEDIDSSDGSLEDLSNHQDEEMQENNNLEIQSKLEVDALEAIIQQDIFAKVVSMCDMFMLEESIHDQLASYSSGIRVLKTLEICSERAMLCLANLLSNIGSELLGGIDAVQNVWLKLSKLLTNRKVVDSVELLDAVSTALRSIAQKLAEGNPVQLHNVRLQIYRLIFKEVTESDLQVLFEMGLKCNVNQVRANAVSIISTIGTSLAKQSPPHPLLQHIGHYFLEIVACDTQLWVIAEALDAIFDVFSEDHTNCVLQQISLVEKLKEFIPVLKQRVKKEKRSLGEHLPVIYTARNNLVRFIQYKEKSAYDYGTGWAGYDSQVQPNKV